MKDLRKLLWLYLILLIFEGALRKWIIPALDAPLLIIRDPLVIWIYMVARQQGLSFENAFFKPNLFLAIASGLASTFFGSGRLAVTVYGLRTDFLQIPLIFLIPQIINRNDVVAMGKFILRVTLPITLLVLLQFRSSPDDWVNKGAFRTHYGTVRPSGTFSFIPGLVAFYAMVASFVFYGFVRVRIYPIWLVTSVTFMLLLGSSVSGSRSCLVSVGIVAATAVICVVIRGKGGFGLMIGAVVISLLVPLLSFVPAFNDGYKQLMQRFGDAGYVEGGTSGFVDRYADTMLGPLALMEEADLFGSGLGLGTNAGQALMMGGRTTKFVNGSENEWGRVIYEGGPIFGFLFIILRLAITLAIFKSAFDALRRNNPLPMLIFAGCGLLIFNGQWGVPTTLGFAIFGGGLALAACVEPEEHEEEEEESEDEEHEDHEDGEHENEHDGADEDHSAESGRVA